MDSKVITDEMTPEQENESRMETVCGISSWKETQQRPNNTVTTEEYPPKKVILPAMAAIYLAVFLVALDRTIIGTAIPVITNQFNSFGDVAWYEAGFLLPFCALQLSFGRVYKYYSTKWILVALVAIFEIGSVVCAAAPTSNALIVGRVVSGIGAAGIASGSFMLITLLLPLQKRPKYAGGLGAVFGVASILGPIAGGNLTQVSWRWCFWINAAIGGVSLLLLLLVPDRAPPVKPATTWWGKIRQLDPLGFVLISSTTTCLLFALQWGGVQYAWNDGRIIALFVISGVLVIIFIAAQAWMKNDATVPWKVISQRSILASCFAQAGIGPVLVGYAFYLPIWFQVIQGESPQSSGLSLLPLLLSNVIAVMVVGLATSKLGYYTPFMIVGGVVVILGSALITTWTVNVGAGKWISYQVCQVCCSCERTLILTKIVTGFGLGLVLQGPNVSAQTVLPDSEVSIGLSLLNFISLLGGSIFVTVSQTLMQNKLQQGLKDILPGVDIQNVTNSGTIWLRTAVPSDKLLAVLRLYNDSIRAIWYLYVGLACLILLSSLGLEWKNVKSQEHKQKAGDDP
ncbi:hypothetical protein LTR84_001249 [Exophiala bonariae]|uniref:Major facilitator superfamily (MFS) profile domain-containing protein n=1 Tax=Exophiala bonariae TaxID=1690606 RepID=A0AAV9NT91_9EURO|nr:hypothetical protein LTR84_001249 [Exophiala bonariae]